MKGIIIIALLGLTTLLKAQEYCRVPIRLSFFDQTHRFFKGDFNDKIGDNIIKGVLKTCKGEMSIEIYSSDSTLMYKGNYIESLDTLKEYTLGYYIDEGREEIEVLKYFKPLKHGEWSFYDEKGKLLRKEEYKRGIKVDKIEDM